jgi:hypothetical protein
MEQPPLDIVDREPPTPKFTQQDKCDTCRAQVSARAIVHGSELLFCMHHFGAGEERLIVIAETVDVDYDGFTRWEDER